MINLKQDYVDVTEGKTDILALVHSCSLLLEKGEWMTIIGIVFFCCIRYCHCFNKISHICMDKRFSYEFCIPHPTGYPAGQILGQAIRWDII